jgi:hypothetical protein
MQKQETPKTAADGGSFAPAAECYKTVTFVSEMRQDSPPEKTSQKQVQLDGREKEI